VLQERRLNHDFSFPPLFIEHLRREFSIRAFQKNFFASVTRSPNALTTRYWDVKTGSGLSMSLLGGNIFTPRIFLMTSTI